VKFTSANPFAPEFVQAHLATDKSHARAKALYDERVRRRQLVLAERNHARGERERTRTRGKRNGRGTTQATKGTSTTTPTTVRMGRREAAEKGVWRMRKEEARWDAFVPLHRLWLGYMSELLGLPAVPRNDLSSLSSPAPVVAAAAMPRAAEVHLKLVKADFHGSIMTVRKSKNPALVGASGIVVQETENTFKVVTRKDKLKVLPKQGSVFVFAVPLFSTVAAASPTAGRSETDDSGDLSQAGTVLDGPRAEIELYGNQFCFRSADRAGRKFKHKETIEL